MFICPHVWTPPICLDGSICMNACTHLYSPMLSCTSVCSMGVSANDMGMGHIYAHILGSGDHRHICQTFWCLSVHPLFSVCGCFLLNLILLDVCYTSCCCTFLCKVSLCQVSTTMAMTTMPLVTVVSSGMSSLSLVPIALSFKGPSATLGQCDMVLLTPRSPGGVIGLASIP